MGRAPCCEKMGLKKGPWTPEEDQILITYIHLYGHSNWRALPKQAGLLRCGKSCRLRWTNYLRPDIKRGNFTKEEEDTIISLHQMLGNRWSAIAARLPGRTDNEIKNVWHTHLKKRLAQQQHNDINIQTPESDSSTDKKRQKPPQFTNPDRPKKRQQPVILPVPAPASDANADPPLSPCGASDVSSSSVTTSSHLTGARLNLENNALSEEIIDDSFWSEVLSAENSVPTVEFDEAGPEADNVQYSSAASPLASVEMVNDTNTDDDMDFWYNLFTRAGDMLELPEF